MWAIILLRQFRVLPDKEKERTSDLSKEKNEMNRLKHVVGGMWRAGLVVAAGGTVLASSCSTSEVRTVLAGVELVTNEIDQAQSQNISVGDWLSSLLNK